MKLVPETAPSGEGPLPDAARFDRATFTTLAQGCRRELLVHCYRMLGSYHDAEDLVQETLLRAWKARATFAGRSTLRAWLYRIATNACLDFLARHERRVVVAADLPPGRQEVPWLEPAPDRILDTPAPDEEQPDARVVSRENIELAFLVTLQLLSPRQRAAVILCDVLDWTAREAAELLDMTPAAVNGALRRARTTLARNPKARAAEWTRGEEPGEEERALLAKYVEFGERGDVNGLAGLLRDDVRCAMPPEPGNLIGKELVVRSWVEGGYGSAGLSDFRAIIMRANRMPAVAFYLREPGSDIYKPLTMDVLTVADGVITDILTFALAPLLEAFGLPAELPARGRAGGSSTAPDADRGSR